MPVTYFALHDQSDGECDQRLAGDREGETTEIAIGPVQLVARTLQHVHCGWCRLVGWLVDSVLV